jgi:hypothetical protein
MQAQLGVPRQGVGRGRHAYVSGNVPLSGGGTPPQVPPAHTFAQHSLVFVQAAPFGRQPGEVISQYIFHPHDTEPQ